MEALKTEKAAGEERLASQIAEAEEARKRETAQYDAKIKQLERRVEELVAKNKELEARNRALAAAAAEKSESAATAAQMAELEAKHKGMSSQFLLNSFLVILSVRV